MYIMTYILHGWWFLWHGFLFLVCLTSHTAVSWTHTKTYEKTTSYAGYTCMTYNWFLPLCKTKLIIYNNSHFIIQCSTLKKNDLSFHAVDPLLIPPPPRLKILGLLALLLAAKNVSPGGTSAPQRQKFHTDDVKSVQNLVSRSDWST